MGERLIDISGYNPVNDAAAVRRAGVLAASIKCTQATNYLNPLRLAQVQSLRAAGVATGGYHFGDPRFDANAQAHYFADQAILLGLHAEDSLFPMYDAENWAGNFSWNKTALNQHIAEWLRVQRQRMDSRGYLVYASQSWWSSGMLDRDAWGDTDVFNWVAKYNFVPAPGNIAPWGHAQDALHQFRSDAVVAGIPALVDDNTTLRGRLVADLITRRGHTMGLSAEERAVLDTMASEVARINDFLAETENSPVDPDTGTTATLFETNWTTRSRIAAAVADTKALVQTSHDDLAHRIAEASGGSGSVLTDEQADRVADRLGVQLGAMTSEKLDAIQQELAAASSPTAVADLLARYDVRLTPRATGPGTQQ